MMVRVNIVLNRNILLRFIKKNEAPPRTNFDDFQNAMLAVFQVGEDSDEAVSERLLPVSRHLNVFY